MKGSTQICVDPFIVDRWCEQVDAIPVVAPAEAIAQLAATMPPLRLRHTAIDARFRGQLPDGSLEELVDIDPHRPGRAELRELAADLASDGSDSGFEHRARRGLVQAGLTPAPGPVKVRTRLGYREIDIGFPPVQVGIECVGFKYHSTRDQLDRDARRQNEIATLDEWLILQLTWSMLFGSAWHRFVDQVRAAIAERSRAR